MGLPAKRRTRTSKRDRASHFALKGTGTTPCPHCGATILPHRACSACGMYRGKKAVDVAKRTTRRAKRLKAVK